MTRILKSVAAVALVAVAFAGCGGSDDKAKDGNKDGEAAGTTSSTVPGGGSGQTTPGAGDPSGSGAPAGQGSGSPQGTAPSGSGSGSGATSQQQKPPLPFEVTLRYPCVRAGGQQSITIKATPGSGVGFDSHYSDGKTGISEGFYGGNSGAVMPASGTWEHTWVISPNAPAGKVKVVSIGTHVDYAPAETEHFFDLVPATSSCP